MKTRLKTRISPSDAVILFVVTVICLSMLYPFINLLFISLSDSAAYYRNNGLLLYPQGLTFEAYTFLWDNAYLWRQFSNTVFITVVGTLLSLVLTTIAAYILCHRDLPGVKAMTSYILVTMFISGGLVPTYLNYRSLGLLNSLWVLIIPGSISAWNLFLERNFFWSIPGEIRESAVIDGAGNIRLLISIMIPLAMPVIATLALYYGVAQWNTYMGAVLYNTKQEYKTLQVFLHNIYINGLSTYDLMADENTMTPQNVRSAAVIFVSLPIICVYPFLQKYFAKGVMVGSIKG